MQKKQTYTVKFHRKLRGKTDYNRRLRLLKSNKPRIVVRKSLKNIYLQLVDFNIKGDKAVTGVSSSELSKLGWKYSNSNLSGSYLTGLLFGKKLKDKKVKQCILDTGLHQSIQGSRIYAAVKGIIDAGIEVPASQEVLPKEDRISGKHISDYSANLKKENNEIYKKQFSRYIANNLDPEKISNNFKEVKEKILKM